MSSGKLYQARPSTISSFARVLASLPRGRRAMNAVTGVGDGVGKAKQDELNFQNDQPHLKDNKISLQAYERTINIFMDVGKEISAAFSQKPVTFDGTFGDYLTTTPTFATHWIQSTQFWDQFNVKGPGIEHDRKSESKFVPGTPTDTTARVALLNDIWSIYTSQVRAVTLKHEDGADDSEDELPAAAKMRHASGKAAKRVADRAAEEGTVKRSRNRGRDTQEVVAEDQLAREANKAKREQQQAHTSAPMQLENSIGQMVASMLSRNTTAAQKEAADIRRQALAELWEDINNDACIATGKQGQLTEYLNGLGKIRVYYA